MIVVTGDRRERELAPAAPVPTDAHAAPAAGRAWVWTRLQVKATNYLGDQRCVFFGENAWQELEVWILAGQRDLPREWVWQDVRRERDPKETYYDVYAAKRGVANAAYEGREVLAKEAARNYRRIRRLCREDVLALEQRVNGAFEK